MRNVDKLVIVDIEATCWDNENGSPDRTMLPRRDESEIIEVGVCTLDLKTLEIGDIDGIIVKPANSTVSDFCTKLTTLTQADVDKGISFDAACQILRKKYNSKNRTWASYGQYDANIFKRECDSKKVNYPFGNFHINIKAVVETIYGETLGMSEALDAMMIVLEGTHHRGVDDAKNIARIYAQFLKNVRTREGLPS